MRKPTLNLEDRITNRIDENTIRTQLSFVNDPKPKGAMDFTIYARVATKIDDTHFVIKHLTDPTKNVEI